MQRRSASSRRSSSAGGDENEDPYKVLGLARNASEGEIKKAYRQLALKWHPDRNPTNQAQAEREFKRVSKAYALLSDAEQRAMYDRFGSAAAGSGGLGGRPAQGQPFTEAEAAEIFKQMFGNKPIQEIIREVEQALEKEASQMDAKEAQLRSQFERVQQEAVALEQRANQELNPVRRLQIQRQAMLKATQAHQMQMNLLQTQLAHGHQRSQHRFAMSRLRSLDPEVRAENNLRRGLSVGAALGAYFVVGYSFFQSFLVYFVASFLTRVTFAVLRGAANQPRR